MSSTYKFTIVGKDATRAAFKSIRTGLSGVRSAVNSTQLKMGALAGIAGLGAVIKANSATIDSMAKMSDRLNITTEDLAAYHQLTQLNGESTESFDKSLEKMTRSVGEASRGLGTGKIALEQMGIKIEDIIGLDAGKQFEIIAEGISKQGSQALKASLAADIFGRSGVKLLNTINQGSEGIAQARDEVEQYGLSLSRVDAAKVEDANDQLLRVGQVAKGLGQKLTISLAPFISVISEKLIGVATDGDRMGESITKAIGFAVKTVGIFADGLRGIKVIFSIVKLAATGFATAFTGILTGIATAVFRVGFEIKAVFLGVFQDILTPLAKISDVAGGVLQSINAQLKEGPTTPAFVKVMQDATFDLVDNIALQRQELQELLMLDLPSAVIEQRWAEIQAEAEARAAETAAKIHDQLNAPQNTQVLGETDVERESRERKEQLESERLASRLLRLDESHFTELQQIAAKNEQELELLREGLDAQALTREEFDARVLRSNAAREKAETELASAGASARKGILTATLGQMAAFVGNGSKKIFKIQKAVALAQAAVAVPAAVIESFKNAGGYPWGIPPAAAMAATGAAQIANIRKQSIGSAGGGLGSVGGGGGGIQTPQVAALIQSGAGSQFDQSQQSKAKPQTIVNFSVAGDVIGDTAESVLEKMRSLIEDSDAVLFSSNSRQAAELALA